MHRGNSSGGREEEGRGGEIATNINFETPIRWFFSRASIARISGANANGEDALFVSMARSTGTEDSENLSGCYLCYLFFTTDVHCEDIVAVLKMVENKSKGEERQDDDSVEKEEKEKEDEDKVDRSENEEAKAEEKENDVSFLASISFYPAINASGPPPEEPLKYPENLIEPRAKVQKAYYAYEEKLRDEVDVAVTTITTLFAEILENLSGKENNITSLLNSMDNAVSSEYISWKTAVRSFTR